MNLYYSSKDSETVILHSPNVQFTLIGLILVKILSIFTWTPIIHHPPALLDARQQMKQMKIYIIFYIIIATMCI